MTALRVVAQALAVPFALIVAVIAQLAVVNRAPLPAGTGPDLVLLTVTAVAVCTGPLTGMLAGFAGGLALDVAPPASHLAGEYALVFCLVGYACGRVRNAILHARGEMTMVTSLTVMVLGVAAGEAGKAALGRLVSDPDVTTVAIRHVLPAAVIYDVLLCPIALWLVSLMLRRPAQERAPHPEFTQVATVFRAASAGAVPRLRLAGSTPAPARTPARAEPKLRLSAGRSAPLSGTYAAFSGARAPLPGGRAVKLNFAQNGHAAPGQWQRVSPGKGWLSTGRPAGAATPRRTGPGKGWISVRRPAGGRAVRSTSPPGGWLRVKRPGGTATLRSMSPPRGWLRVQPSAGARTLRRRSPGKGWLRPAGLAAPRRRLPGRGGWVRPAAQAQLPRSTAPPKGWIRPAKPAPLPKRKSPRKRWIRPVKPARQSFYSTAPSTRWVRRSRSPWPGRRRRLLALMGGRK
jgi:rod shape-determining protein MreD